MTPAHRAALSRDVAQTIARLAQLDLDAMPDAFREFAERLEQELRPADMGPGIGGVARAGADDPRW